MEIGKSARLYQERKGLRVTNRGPGPVMGLNDNLVHSIPMEPPFPVADLQEPTNGSPPPDTGRTKPWPHGETTIV
jgi:hypothetical protein